MSEWKNEDEIKAELRAMTTELRRLREGLRNLVSPPKQNPTRSFLNRQSWPSAVEHPPPDREHRPPPHNESRSPPNKATAQPASARDAKRARARKK